MMTLEASLVSSPHLFFPEGGVLHAYSPQVSAHDQASARIVNGEITRKIKQLNYPCVGARIALKKDEYRVGIYSDLGLGKCISDLGRDLLVFKQEHQISKSPMLSFIAVFENSVFHSEEEFETALWKELSLLASAPEFEAPWDPHFSSNPEDKNFCFSFDGSAFFIVGLHPLSSRVSRQFYVPTLAFNLYEQFEQLDEETEFYPMVRKNRQRDVLYQGSVNPMVEQHAEKWEAIHFSGKNNPPEWKCPVHRFLNGLRS